MLTSASCLHKPSISSSGDTICSAEEAQLLSGVELVEIDKLGTLIRLLLLVEEKFLNRKSVSDEIPSSRIKLLFPHDSRSLDELDRTRSGKRINSSWQDFRDRDLKPHTSTATARVLGEIGVMKLEHSGGCLLQIHLPLYTKNISQNEGKFEAA